MKRLYVLIPLLGLLISQAAAQKTHRKLAFFQTEKAELTAETEESLTRLYATVPDSTRFRFELMGLVDRKDPATKISSLMASRAKNLAAFFKDQGLHASLVSLKKAELNPFLLNNTIKRDSVQSWAVEVFVIRGEIEIYRPTITPIAHAFPKRDKDFKFNPQKKLKLVCPEGTKIKAPRNAFVFADGSPAVEEVKLNVTEYYSKADFLMADLTTMCNDRLIESGGMLHISATCQGREVFVADGKSLSISLPANGEHKPGMELFLGQETASGVNWKLGSAMLDRRGRGQRQNSNYYNEMINTTLDDTGTVNLAMDNNIYNTVNVQNNDLNYLNRNVTNGNTWGGGKMAGVLQGSLAGDKYLLETTELGWINCDRFYEVEEKAPLMVDVDTTYHPSVRLVFRDINSVMQGWYNPETAQYEFQGLPVGQRATLVAYSIVDGKAYFDLKEVTISKRDGELDLRLAEMSEDELKRNFRRMNRG